MAAAEVVGTAGKVATAVADMAVAATAAEDMALVEAATVAVVVATAVVAGTKVVEEATETASARVAGEVAAAETLAPATATATVADQCGVDQEATRSVALALTAMAVRVATGDKQVHRVFNWGGGRKALRGQSSQG